MQSYKKNRLQQTDVATYFLTYIVKQDYFFSPRFKISYAIGVATNTEE